MRPPALVVAVPLLLGAQGLVLPVQGQSTAMAQQDAARSLAPADYYTEGVKLRDQGHWQEALDLWEEGRDELSAAGVHDPRIGTAYVELATEKDADDRYATASEMVLWGFSDTPIDGSRSAAEDELDRILLIMGDSTRAKWAELKDAPEDELLLRLKEFWIEKDPTPSTPLNERLIEHWRRIAEARRRFVFNRRSVIGTDDRGVVFLRYGEPARVKKGSLGASEHELMVRVPRDPEGRAQLRNFDVHPQYEVWVYDQLNDQGFTYFLFGNVDGTGPFELVNGVHDLIPTQARSRASARYVPGGVPASYYLELFYYQDLSAVGGQFGDRFSELDQLWNLYTQRRKGYVSASRIAPLESEMDALGDRYRMQDEFDPVNPPQTPVLSAFEGHARDELIAQMVRTLSDDDVPLLMVLATSAPRLTADRRDAYRQELNVPGWTMRHTLIIRDQHFDEVGRLVLPVDPEHADASQFVIRHVPQPLHLTVTAQTFRQAEVEEGAEAPDTLVASARLPGQVHLNPEEPLSPDPDHFEMSDLLTGTPVPPEVDARALPFDVLPARRIWRRDPLRIYLELYHLGQAPDGAADVEARFTVVPLLEDGSVDRDREPVTLDDISLRPDGRTYRQFFDIALRDQDVGPYRIEVEITDRVRGETLRREARIELQN